MYTPFPNGTNTMIAGYTQLIGGLLFALSELLKVATQCLNGALTVSMCVDALPPLVIAVAVAANGLGQLGLGNKVEQVKADTKEIKATSAVTAVAVDAVASTADQIQVATAPTN